MRRFEAANPNGPAVWQDSLLDDAKSEMGDARGLDDPHAFQFNLLVAELIEQAGPLTKQDRHQMKVDFIKQSGLEALLSNTRAVQADIFVPCGGFGLCKEAFDPVSHKGVCRSPLLDDFFPGFRCPDPKWIDYCQCGDPSGVFRRLDLVDLLDLRHHDYARAVVGWSVRL